MKNAIPSTAAGLLVAALFLIPAVIQASILANQTTGSTIFDDNFEGGTVDSMPVATIGTWTSNAPGDTVVLNGAWGGGLGPYAGTKMLGFWSNSEVALTGTGIEANSGSSDVIKMQLAFCMQGEEVSIYAKSGATELFQIGLFGPNAPGAFRKNGVYVVNSAGTAWLDTNFTQNPNAWNTLTVTHTNGTTDWAISFNGGAAYDATGYNVSNPWYSFVLKNDAPNNVAYFDAVPEPASLGLLALGGLVLLRRRRS